MAQVQGLNPSVLVAPDYQTQQMQAQRQLDLANALRSQALSDTPGNGGNVSWTQGLARVLSAFASKKLNKDAMQQMQGANQAYAQGLSRMFGFPGPAAPAPTPLGSPQGSAPAAPSPQPSAPSGAPAATPLSSPTDQQTASPTPAAMPQGAGQQPPAQPPSTYPMSLTGSPQRDFSLYMMNPDKFTEAQIANAAAGAKPTDFAVQLRQSGIDPNSPLGQQIMQQQIAKQNYVAPVNGRPGSTIRDPYNPSHIIGYDAPTVEGALPTYDANGMPTGYRTAPGAAEAVGNMAGAKAGASAAATAPYDVIQGFDPGTQSPTFMPKATVTGGTLNGHYFKGGGTVQAGPSLGQQQAFGTYGAHSADAFAAAQDSARESPVRVQSLREMYGLVTGKNPLNTGPTAAKLQQLAEEHGLTFLSKDNAFVFNKDAARFVAQSASDLGLNGSDQRLGMLANASPNMKMTPTALKTVIPTMIGIEYARMAHATAGAKFAQANPAGNAQFETQWRQNYDPRMFTAYAQGGPQALAHAPAALRQQWLKNYRNLKSMGVDFGSFGQ